MATRGVNQSFSSGFSSKNQQPPLVPLRTPERRNLRTSFQSPITTTTSTTTANNNSRTQKNMNARFNVVPSTTGNILTSSSSLLLQGNLQNNAIIGGSGDTQSQTKPTNGIKSNNNNKATPSQARQAHHSRSKSYCCGGGGGGGGIGGVSHYGIGSTTEIIITSKTRQASLLKNKLVKDEEESITRSSSTKFNQMLINLGDADKENASPQKSISSMTPTRKQRSTSCIITPSSTTPNTIQQPLSTNLINISNREPLTPKSTALTRYETCSTIGSYSKFNAYSKINDIDAISISEDEGKEVWCGERKGIIAIFDTNTCKPVATIYEEKEKLYVSCMCRVGEYMWAGMADGSINIYNIKKRSLVKNLHGHIGTVTDIINLGNDLIASCSVDFSIRLWDSSTFTPKLNCIGLKSLCVNALCSAESGLLWSGSDDSLIRVWDTNTGLAVKEIAHSPFSTKNKSSDCLESSELAISSSSSTSGSNNNNNNNNGEDNSKSSKEYNGSVTQLSYCSKTNRVWSASKDCSVKIWNPTTFTCEHSISFPSYVNCMHIAGQYAWIATNKELSIWNVIDKSLAIRFPVNGFVWSIKTVGDRVWIACSDKSIRVYNVNDESEQSSGVTQMEKRQFQGAKRLSSEFISLDITYSPIIQSSSPCVAKTLLSPTVHHPIIGGAVTGSCGGIDTTASSSFGNLNQNSEIAPPLLVAVEEESIRFEINFEEDFAQQLDLAADASSTFNALIKEQVLSRDDTVILEQLSMTTCVQSSETNNIITSLSDISTHQEMVDNSNHDQIQSILDYEMKNSSACQEISLITACTSKNCSPPSPSINAPMLILIQTDDNSDRNITVSCHQEETKIGHAFFDEVMDTEVETTMKKNPLTSESHNYSIVIKEDFQMPTTNDSLTEMELFMTTTSSFENCESFLPNERLLLHVGDDNDDDEHTTVVGCSSIFKKMFENLLLCMFPRKTTK